jgi:hypothetical protein
MPIEIMPHNIHHIIAGLADLQLIIYDLSGDEVSKTIARNIITTIQEFFITLYGDNMRLD